MLYLIIDQFESNYRHYAPLPLNIKQAFLKKDIFLCDHCMMIISEIITLIYHPMHKFKSVIDS